MTLPKNMIVAMLMGPEQIEIREVPVVPPSKGELLISVEAATTCGTDVKVFRQGGHARMLHVPTLFGHEVSGRVQAVGKGVQKFLEGDAVVVANSSPCLDCDYCNMHRENLCRDLQYLNGAYAEYLLIPERFVSRSTHKIPNKLNFSRAALTEPLACVLHGIDACNLENYEIGSEIAVYGGGPIGLLFVGALADLGFSVILADPNQSRLDVGKAMGAKKVIQIKRDGGQADVVKSLCQNKEGTWVAIDATGQPAVWEDAVSTVRPGGIVNLFGGCKPQTKVSLDAHLLHYSEITVKGVYHHRPDTVRRALMLLAQSRFPADLLLSAKMPIKHAEKALRLMMAKEALKVVISAGS